ncbi:MAG: cytochrome ubiquinol oxidase subunit I [Anaerolineaceae bacterium]
MNIVTLSQIQFASTTIYHFFFVPLTLGLSLLVAIMETMYVSSGKELYKKMAKFWGKLFLINFAMGVVTGIVLEFQFGMNWSEYSRFVGDIFGAPLAIEALVAFFLESIFLGVWIFGWGKLSKGLHLMSIWLVAFGVTLSALWILVANSFMQEPVGYAIEGGRAVMTDFAALVFSPHVWVQFPHTVLSGYVTGAFFILGVSAYHLIRKQHEDFFRESFRLGAIAGTIAIILVVLVGHRQAQLMVKVQPMKMAAAEALLESEDPAGLSLITIIDEEKQEETYSIRIPNALSFLAYNTFEGEVKGIKNLQAEYEGIYGPGDYSPSIFMLYWTFRAMVGAGFAMVAIALYALFLVIKKYQLKPKWLFALFPFAALLPYLANTTGWIMTEMGRQPWVVFGLVRTADAVSPNLTPGMVLTTLIGFALIYGLLIAADIYLLLKYIKIGPVDDVHILEPQNIVEESRA